MDKTNSLPYNPLVSIALASYNGEKFIRQQLDSILKQTYEDIEVIVSDDGSTDATISILDEYSKGDKRISYSKNPAPRGFKKNFERAILLCKGEIIFLCDQDDVWSENKIEEHLKVYKDKKINWVYNTVRLIDNAGKDIGLLTDRIPDYYFKRSLFVNSGGGCILGCATSYRAECIKNIWPIDDIAPSHDSWIQMAIYPAQSFHVNMILQDYRQHEDNIFGVFKKPVITDRDEDIRRNIQYQKNNSRNKLFVGWKRLYFFFLYFIKTIKNKLRILKRLA